MSDFEQLTEGTQGGSNKPKTRSQRKAENLEVVQYLLGEVLGLETEQMEFVAQDQGYEKPAMLAEMKEADVDVMYLEQHCLLKKANKRELLKLAHFLKTHREETKDLSPMEWKVLITMDEFEARWQDEEDA